MLLETDGREWGPVATAEAIADAARRAGRDGPYDLLLFGNEAADTGDYQVAVRVAHALGLPCVTGIKNLEISRGRRAWPGGSTGAGRRSSTCPLPAVISVKEGINLPRYPSLPGRLRAKRAAIERLAPAVARRGAAQGRAAGAGHSETSGRRCSARAPRRCPRWSRLLEDLGVLS